MVHGGCNVNSISDTQRDLQSPGLRPVEQRRGNPLLYQLRCHIVPRKGFTDAPEGFAEGYSLSDRANFGSCWRSYSTPSPTMVDDQAITSSGSALISGA